MAVDPTFAQGIDLSKWNVSYDASVKPVDFVIQRVSYGITADQKLEELWVDTQPVPIRGCYHYYMSRFDWQRQADFYLEMADDRYAFYAWDYETIGNFLTKETAADAIRAMQYIQEQTGKPCFLYTNPATYTASFTNNKLDPSGFPLWVSQWFERSWYYSDNVTGPNLPVGVNSFDIWQYGGDYRHPEKGWSVPGYKQGAEYGVENDSIDLNAYNGTPQQMAERLGLDADDPGTPSDPMPAYDHDDFIRQLKERGLPFPV